MLLLPVDISNRPTIIPGPTGSDSNCTKGIPYYQKTYGGTKDDAAYHAAPTADSGYVLAGYTSSFGSGGHDGLLMKVDRNGNTLWSKAIGGTGDDVFNEIRRTSDNGFIAAGQTKSYGNAAGDVWLVKLDASGNVQWTKKYGDGNVNGEVAYDVIQLADGGYAFCGTHRFSPGVAESFVTRTDNQGNVLWSKQYGNSLSDNASGILEDGNFLMVVGFYQGVSFYDGYLMKLDKSNGAMQWIKGYDAEGRSTWMGKIGKTASGYQVFSLITDNYLDQNQQECIWNLNTDGTVQNVRKLSIPTGWTISYGWYPLADGGFVAINSDNSDESDAIFCRVNANGTLAWSKKHVRNGKQQLPTVMPSPDGGYAGIGFSNNVPAQADSNNVYILKVDSVGNGSICSGTVTTELTVVTPSYALVNPDIIDKGNVTINPPTITAGVVNFVPVINRLCYYCQLISPTTPPNNTCAKGISYYQKTYGGTKDDAAYHAAPTADSGYVLAGYTSSFGSGGHDGLLMKVDRNGNTLWSKAIGGTGDDVFNEIRRTSDNGFIAAGRQNPMGMRRGCVAGETGCFGQCSVDQEIWRWECEWGSGL